MAYLIDGHNLIPNVRGLSLRAVDDEQQLIDLLQVFSRLQRRNIEVYFDKAPPGQARKQGYGLVAAYFVRQGSTADAAISARLQKLRRNAPNWTVVSSDRQVQAEAHSAGAQVLSSQQFASQLQDVLSREEQNPQPEDAQMDDTELQDWLRLFGSGDP